MSVQSVFTVVHLNRESNFVDKTFSMPKLKELQCHQLSPKLSL